MPSRVARLRMAQAVESQFDTSAVAAFEAILAARPRNTARRRRADFEPNYEDAMLTVRNESLDGSARDAPRCRLSGRPRSHQKPRSQATPRRREVCAGREDSNARPSNRGRQLQSTGLPDAAQNGVDCKCGLRSDAQLVEHMMHVHLHGSLGDEESLPISPFERPIAQTKP